MKDLKIFCSSNDGINLCEILEGVDGNSDPLKTAKNMRITKSGKNDESVEACRFTAGGQHYARRLTERQGCFNIGSDPEKEGGKSRF